MSEAYGACKFCGQMNTEAFRGCETHEQANEYTTLSCNCDEAKRYADRAHSIKRVGEQIEDLFGEGAAEYGLPSAKQEVKEIMFTASVLIYDGLLKDISINLTASGKVKISKSSKGKLTFMRSEAAVFKQEV